MHRESETERENHKIAKNADENITSYMTHQSRLYLNTRTRISTNTCTRKKTVYTYIYIYLHQNTNLIRLSSQYRYSEKETAYRNKSSCVYV